MPSAMSYGAGANDYNGCVNAYVKTLNYAGVASLIEPRNYFNCPTCGAGIIIKDGQGIYECSVCDDEVLIDGGSYYLDFIDEMNNDVRK